MANIGNARLHILGIAGSLRRDSFNKALLRCAKELAPEEVEVEIFDLEGIPLFNQDLEKNPSLRVKELKAKVRSADGILFATPEYNYSMPGVLKNAIDAASRPYGDNPFDGKPVAIMGASVGMIGTARAQYHLRQTMVFLNMLPLNRPEVMVTFANEKFDEAARLTDDITRKKVEELVLALAEWINKVKAIQG
jgi:chromate reductase